MRTRFISKAALLCAVLLGFAAPCPASETTEGLKAGDRVTLVGTTLKKSELPAPQHFKGGESSPSSSAAPTSGNKS